MNNILLNIKIKKENHTTLVIKTFDFVETYFFMLVIKTFDYVETYLFLCYIQKERTSYFQCFIIRSIRLSSLLFYSQLNIFDFKLF
jgi:hypothetical protein